MDFGRANLFDKARQQPDRVRQVVDKAMTEGVGETLEAVRSKLAQRLPLGYANAGVVVAAGTAVAAISVGDLVASNGGHADLVNVPATLVARVPVGVAAEEACFASVGAIALEGIRLASCEIGGRVAVTGLGLVGLLAVQLLQATGCSVLGIDPDPARRHLAEQLGATTAAPEAAESAAAGFSRGRGVDAVLVCASTKSSDPMTAAVRMCRERGTVVLVGVTGLELDRSDLYAREVTVRVSRSYGPGRYDERYEGGHDYPFGLVRWTAGRNMEAFLDLLGRGAIDVQPLISHRFDFERAADAYDLLVERGDALGIVLEYGDTSLAPALATAPAAVAVTSQAAARHATSAPAAVIGAGNFASRTLVPAIRDAGGDIGLVAARGSAAPSLVARDAGARAAADVDEVFDADQIGPVFVATRHDSHAALVVRAMRSRKPVYVEKPLALAYDELDEIERVAAELAASGEAPLVAVGFNRRFAPITVEMKRLLAPLPPPAVVVITVNAGAIPSDHWVHDPEVGGGRLLGEGCHFIDLARHLVGSPIAAVESRRLAGTASADTGSFSLRFESGSRAEIHYLANGAARYPKERIEVFAHGRVLVNENFRRLVTYGMGRRFAVRPGKQDKGHAAAVRAFLDAARTGAPPPVPLPELLEVSRAAIAAARPA